MPRSPVALAMLVILRLVFWAGRRLAARRTTGGIR